MGKFIFRGSLFMVIVFGMFTMIIYGFSNIRYDKNYTLLQQVTGNPISRGDDTFPKFFEAERMKEPLDILIVGSSRAYHALNPAVFEKYNLKVHVLASRSQTPLNTYYVLRRYLPLLKPKLVLLDVHLGMLNNNGLESLYDLCANLPISSDLFDMALAINQPNAYTVCYASLINQLDTPIYKNYKYVPGSWCYKGFVASEQMDTAMKISKWDTVMDNREILPQEKKNLQYVEDIIRFVQENHAKIVLTRMPVLGTEALPLKIAVKDIAKKYDVAFIDFNRARNKLDPRHDYYDKFHLNSYGAAMISEMMIKVMEKKGIKP